MTDSLTEKTLLEETDKYFSKTARIVEENGDVEVIYAFFIRQPVIYAPKLIEDFLKQVKVLRKKPISVFSPYQEGDFVGGGNVLLLLKGSLQVLSEVETLCLQKLGPPCVIAYTVFHMTHSCPYAAFMAMDSRHCTGKDMAIAMAYGAFVGSKKAQAAGAKGFIGTSTDLTAPFFGLKRGLGTMPHSLIGYAKDTLKAAQLYHRSFPHDPLTVLIDYFGKELDDTLRVCQHFSGLVDLAVRIDTHGGRYVQGLDPERSYGVIERCVPEAIRHYREPHELHYLLGTGVSAAALFHLRETLDKHGFEKVKITASSNFTTEKCKLFGSVKAPVNTIGTGSYFPHTWSSTYATADIITYNGQKSVKRGREFLLSHLPQNQSAFRPL